MNIEWQAEQMSYPLDVDYIGESSHIFELDAAAEKIVGKLNAGNTFIYLFRRFGYPRFGWDGMKELVLYKITTPMDGVVLIVEPDVTGAFTFAYMLREDINQAYEEEERKPYDDWTKQFEAWALEDHGVEIIRIFEQDNDKLYRVWKVWGVDKEYRDFASEKDAHNAFFTDQEFIRAKYVEMYKEISAFPRIIPLKDRPADSIMKQCHVALCDAIRDLLRPVYVRDVMINVCGFVGWDEARGDDDAVNYAIGSGCGVGDKLGSVSGGEHAATIISNLDRWKFRRCVESIKRYGCSSREEGISVKCDACTYDIPTDEWETLQRERMTRYTPNYPDMGVVPNRMTRCGFTSRECVEIEESVQKEVADHPEWLIAKKINSVRGKRDWGDSISELKTLGFKILGDYDELFFRVQPPERWTKTTQGYWTKIVDTMGNVIISQFHKGAFYDRDAFLDITELEGIGDKLDSPDSRGVQE